MGEQLGFLGFFLRADFLAKVLDTRLKCRLKVMLLDLKFLVHFGEETNLVLELLLKRLDLADRIALLRLESVHLLLEGIP